MKDAFGQCNLFQIKQIITCNFYYFIIIRDYKYAILFYICIQTDNSLIIHCLEILPYEKNYFVTCSFTLNSISRDVCKS
jgi:hypothetical protein